MVKVLFVTSCSGDVRELASTVRGHWSVSTLKNPENAPGVIAACTYDLVFIDIALNGCYGPGLLDRILAVPGHPPVFILSREFAYCFYRQVSRTETCGYIHIPYTRTDLLRRTARFLAVPGRPRQLTDQVPDAGPRDPGTALPAVSSSVASGNPAGRESIADFQLIGKSPSMIRLRGQIRSCACSGEPVLILGETGSGKDLVARLIHENSAVSSGPFETFNASCITVSLAESTLFGTVRGSFTDAADSKGLFEKADGGTLFLDEIATLDVSLQPKFLRVLEDKRVSRIGSGRFRPVDFRLVCATNCCLKQAVSDGLFREDLYYRLDVLRIEIPPLREHPEDIPLLAASWLRRHRKILSDRTIDKLVSYRWPGNVRHLFQCLSRAAAAAREEVIYPDQILF